MTAPTERTPVTPMRNGEDAGHRRDTSRPDPAPRIAGICPYLLAEGHWRSIDASRDHRCTAVEPPAVLALDKQRRLCLDVLHAECPTYLAAVAAREERVGPARREPSRFVRTAPLVVERSRPALGLSERLDRRRGGQAGLIVLMLLALLAVVVSRLPVDSGTTTTPSPLATSAAAASPSPASTSMPPATTIATPSAPPPASIGPSASPSGSPATQTYRVKAGDTLSAIAVRFHTSVAAIQQLNGIRNASVIRIGQILKIPSH